MTSGTFPYETDHWWPVGSVLFTIQLTQADYNLAMEEIERHYPGINDDGTTADADAPTGCADDHSELGLAMGQIQALRNDQVRAMISENVARIEALTRFNGDLQRRLGRLSARASAPPATPPPILDEWEAYVMADDCPAVCIMDRANVRALLRYVRRLEREVDQGSFW